VRLLCGREGKLIKINELRDSDGLKLNLYIISIEYPINSMINYQTITGKQKICGETLFITKYGDPIRCTFCEEFGHKKSECSKFNLKCTECGKRGHAQQNCTMANKIATEEEENQIDIDQDDEAQIEATTNNKNTSKLTPLTQISETDIIKQSKATSNKSNKKKESDNKKTIKTEKINLNRNMTPNNAKRKDMETSGSADKQQDKKVNNQDKNNTSNNSSLNNVDLDVELSEEDLNSIAIALSKQLD
jgi:hypothetical protein